MKEDICYGFRNWFYFCFTNSMFWIRVPKNGSGYCIRNSNINPLRFSERYGHGKYYKVGNIIISKIKKHKT